MLREFSGDFIQWLRTFCVVAETGSVHKAANLLHRSPSTVSLQIKKLETELRRILFRRIAAGMLLLPEGHYLLEQAKSALDILDGMRDSEQYEKELSGVIVISSVHRHATDFLLACVRRFKKRHSKVNFIIHSASWERIIQQVDNYDVNMGITIAYETPPNLLYTECYTTQLQLIMPKGNPFQVSSQPTWEEICELPFIAVTPGAIIHPWLNRVPTLARPRNVVMAVEDSALGISYVRGGLGVCIAPDPTPVAPLSEFTLVPLASFLPPLSVGILQRKESFLSPHASAFLLTALEVGMLYKKRGARLELSIEDIEVETEEEKTPPAAASPS